MRDITFKIVCGVLVLLTLVGFLFACSKKQEATKKNVAVQMSKGFDCTANVNWNGKTYVVKINRPAPGLCTMSFTKPDELSALSFVLDGDGFKVKYGSIEASLDPSTLPQTALFNSVLGALDAAVKPNGLNTSTKDGNVIISGKTTSGNFNLQLDKSNKPKSLEIPDLKLVVGFNEFEWLK
jgi:hypothetical protein